MKHCYKRKLYSYRVIARAQAVPFLTIVVGAARWWQAKRTKNLKTKKKAERLPSFSEGHLISLVRYVSLQMQWKISFVFDFSRAPTYRLTLL